jgi:hypothetical protein
VRKWHRLGTLRDGFNGGWQWRIGSESAGSITYRVTAERVTLHYAIRGEVVTESIPLDRTACHFGGARPWFRCPRCLGRVALLYMQGGRFACRTCQRVAYSSQSEDACVRSWRRQSCIEARLGKDWQRPKGMHRKTHERLMQAILDCDEVRDRALYDFARRLGFEF